jgi:hypothetical protein
VREGKKGEGGGEMKNSPFSSWTLNGHFLAWALFGKNSFFTIGKKCTSFFLIYVREKEKIKK